MTDKKKLTFNTGDCLIEVASLAGLTVQWLTVISHHFNMCQNNHGNNEVYKWYRVSSLPVQLL